jgi:hypothetical protein
VSFVYIPSKGKIAAASQQLCEMPADDGIKLDDPSGFLPGDEKISEEAHEEPVRGHEIQFW